MDAQQHLTVLKEKWDGCTKCELAKTRKSDVVFGNGSFDADYMLIVEAPVEDDLYQGELLCEGEAAALVTDLFNGADIDPADVFKTALLGCRSFVVIPATEESKQKEQERAAPKECFSACRPRLDEIIYTVDPRLIVTMGEAPWKALVPTKARKSFTTVASASGTLFDTWIPGRLRLVRYPVLALLSPQALVANPSAAQHGPLATSLKALFSATKIIADLRKHE